jgi:hypothetical protein
MRYLLTGCLLILTCGVVLAQSEEWKTTTRIEMRYRNEQRYNKDFDSSRPDHTDENLFRLRIGALFENPKRDFAFLFQPQLAADETEARTAFHQLYGEWRPTGMKRMQIRLGRQELMFGDERLVGRLDWVNTGRSFDGARITYGSGGLTSSLFATQLGNAPVKASRPKLYGLYHTLRVRGAHTVDFYGLYKADRISGVRQHVYTFGTRSARSAPQGIGYTAEGAFQFGTRGSRSIEAWAIHTDAVYTFAAAWKPRLLLEYNAASGGNPDDPDKIRTFDQLFPTNHSKYGYIDYQGWKNMRNLRLGVSASPRPNVTVSLDYHWFWLMHAQEAWFGSGGGANTGTGGKVLRDPTGAAGKNVGTELDLLASYSYSKTLSLEAGYARFMPGSFVRQVNNGRADHSDWFYVQARWRQ